MYLELCIKEQEKFKETQVEFSNFEGEPMALLTWWDQGLQELAVLHCCKDLLPSFSEKPDLYTSSTDA